MYGIFNDRTGWEGDGFLWVEVSWDRREKKVNHREGTKITEKEKELMVTEKNHINHEEHRGHEEIQRK